MIDDDFDYYGSKYPKAYAFTTGTKVYFVYAESMKLATQRYLEEHNLAALPSNTTVTRVEKE